MLNWNIIPMTYNDSFTYMEWLGKLNYVAELHEERLDQQEKEIVDLWIKVNDHEDRIGTLETWRTDVVDPFIEDMTVRVGVIEDWRENTVDPFITDITTWKDETVDPFITDIGDWKTETVDPFITDTGEAITRIDGEIDDLEEDLGDKYDELKGDINAERASRETSAGALIEKVDQVKQTADGAAAAIEKLNERIDKGGTIRYYMVDLLHEATITTSGSDKIIEFPIADSKFGVIDVRGHYGTTEFRVTADSLGAAVTADVYTLQVSSSNNDYTATLTITNGASLTLTRLDYILYFAAIKPGEEENQYDVDFYNRMDTNANGVVDAVDASWTLAFYAWASTDAKRDPVAKDLVGQELWALYANMINTDRGTTLLNPQAWPDWTGDENANAVDASNILAYYAWVSTRPDNSLTGAQLMRIYRDSK